MTLVENKLDLLQNDEDNLDAPSEFQMFKPQPEVAQTTTPQEESKEESTTSTTEQQVVEEANVV